MATPGLKLFCLLAELVMVSTGPYEATSVFHSCQYEMSFHYMSSLGSSKPSTILLRETSQSKTQHLWVVLIELLSNSPDLTSHYYLPRTVYLLARFHPLWCLKAWKVTQNAGAAVWNYLSFPTPPVWYSFRGMFPVTGLLSKLNEKLFFKM